MAMVGTRDLLVLSGLIFVAKVVTRAFQVLSGHDYVDISLYLFSE